MQNQLPSQYLKLKSGQILSNCSAGAYDQFLWLYLKGDMAEAAQLAFDKAELAHIEFHYGNLYSEYADFTEVKAIIDGDKKIRIQLTGGRIIKEDAVYEGTLAEDRSDRIPGGEGSGTGDVPSEQPAE